MGIDMKYKVMFGFLIVLLFAGGIFLGMKFGDMREKSDTVSVVNNEENLVYEEDLNSVQTIAKTYDIELVYEDCYTLCGEVVTKKETIYNTTVDELKKVEEEKQEKDGKVYRIKEESNERLVYSRNISENCPNHFLVILEDQVITVYRDVDENTKTVYRKIETSDKLIRDDVKKELEEGIKLDSYEELNLFVEDLES